MKTAKEFRQGQQKLNFPTISIDMRKACDIVFTKVCYVQALPFNLYESEAMRDALQKNKPSLCNTHGSLLQSDVTLTDVTDVDAATTRRQRDVDTASDVTPLTSWTSTRRRRDDNTTFMPRRRSPIRKERKSI